MTLARPNPNEYVPRNIKKLPLQHLTHEIQHGMRRIAIAILGERHMNTTNLDLTILSDKLRPMQSSYPNETLEIDDAAIHFRCGDVCGLTKNDTYGLIKFRSYVERIPNATTSSIGIHTQPFHAAQLREADRDAVSGCKKVVLVLVDYLQQAYPSAKITIRNSKADTIPITYARLIVAPQTITTISTFGIFPAIWTLGEGYYQLSGRQNRFARNISQLLPNFHAMDGPILSSPAIRKASWDKIVKFLTS